MRDDATGARAGDELIHLGLPAEVRAFQGRRAGAVSRSLAAGVDLAVVALGMFAFYLGLAGLLLLWDPRHAQLPDLSRPTLVVVAAVLAVAYLTAAWTTTGRTYGDHLLGLRVVDQHGIRLRAARSAARAVLCVGFPLGLLWTVLSRRNRSLADVVVASMVIYDWTDGSSARLEPGVEHLL